MVKFVKACEEKLVRRKRRRRSVACMQSWDMKECQKMIKKVSHEFVRHLAAQIKIFIVSTTTHKFILRILIVENLILSRY